MLRSYLTRLLRPRPSRRRPARADRFAPRFDLLENRLAPAITAAFSPEAGLLAVIGDSQDNTIVISRDAAGTILVNNGAVAIQGGVATAVNTTQILMVGLSGSDRLALDEANGALPAAHLLGGSGNDTLQGGSGADVLVGGSGDDSLLGGRGIYLLFGQDGNDIVFGNQGDDVAFLGSGDDVFVWNPGEGSDRVEGEAGFDTMLFNGAGVSEEVELSANGGRLRFTRDVANIVMDTDDVERVDFNALGGSDRITVNDLAGTDVREVNLDLQRVLRGDGSGDGLADFVIINGSAGADNVTIAPGGTGGVTVSGLTATVTITGQEAANDQLAVNGLDGDDRIDASGLPADRIALTLDGGAGDDLLLGGAGSDTILGGGGDDFIDAGAGDDLVNGGDGDDVVSGGAGDDVLAGGAGADALDGGPGHDVLDGGPGDDLGSGGEVMIDVENTLP